MLKALRLDEMALRVPKFSLLVNGEGFFVNTFLGRGMANNHWIMLMFDAKAD